MAILRSIFAAILLLMLHGPAAAMQEPIKYCERGDAAENWQSEARANLKFGSPGGELKPIEQSQIDRAKTDDAICVRKNNYWCMKQPDRDSWDGTEGPGNCLKNQDAKGHAIFTSAVYGARAAITALRTYFKRNADSALAIASVRSPSCDTLGSPALWPRSGDKRIGRSCSDAPHPPTTWKGAMCPRRVAVIGECVAGCNCPPEIALGTLSLFPGLQQTDRLPLFDDDCVPQPALTPYLQKLARSEDWTHADAGDDRSWYCPSIGRLAGGLQTTIDGRGASCARSADPRLPKGDRRQPGIGSLGSYPSPTRLSSPRGRCRRGQHWVLEFEGGKVLGHLLPTGQRVFDGAR
jgi:hypothetical protein